jgi:hypothetical protein
MEFAVEIPMLFSVRPFNSRSIFTVPYAVEEPTL